jgi:hypothetical protein
MNSWVAVSFAKTSVLHGVNISIYRTNVLERSTRLAVTSPYGYIYIARGFFRSRFLFQPRKSHVTSFLSILLRVFLDSIFDYLVKKPSSRDSVVGIVTGYGLDDRGVGVRFSAESRIFSSSRRPDRLWGPPNLLSNGYRGLCHRG